MTDDKPSCPHCDSTMTPEYVGGGKWVCSVCSRVFTLATPPKN
jgi:ribosomal protein L37AE/L43A